MSTQQEIARHLCQVEKMGCNCDLDNWEPERNTGHSWVCRIHKEAVQRHNRKWAVPAPEPTEAAQGLIPIPPGYAER